MKCNVLEGPDTTARLFLLAHRALAPGGELGAPYRMAWCLQMLDGSAMVCEELMRLDERRHEGDRWHHRGALGLRAANDGLLLESGMYELLRGYFQRESYYPRAVDTFQQVAQMAILGRCLDLRASEAAGEARLAMFNSQHLADIARHATAYPRLYLPLVLAAAMAGYEESLLGEASELILKIGVYGRFQDDVLGLAAGTRGGTAALELGRCTWPAVVTLQRATPRQRLALQNCYGCSGQDNVSAVKEIYAEVGIEELFADYKREEIKCLSSGVDKIQDENVRDLLRMILNIVTTQIIM
ncbi:farnesyl pyrophosphate synthase-like [Bacillus rossius redtenbacheri]|uniref:farnesyl pyrophosphate synthase-like n=1 Tax=Bacillus rossius redtenbacheri TaxID=93214 RepID=UPI002FDDA6A2